MAFPHALRHALAVAVLRRVTALGGCMEWGYPKEGKWQHDDDCCAGEAQAACAAGYRYVKGCVEENFTARSCRIIASSSTPSTRRLLDGVAMPVPHRSKAPDALVDFHTG